MTSSVLKLKKGSYYFRILQLIHFTINTLLLLNILRPVSIYGLSMLARVGRSPMSCNSPKRVADYSRVFWCEILQLDALPANPTAAAMLKASVIYGVHLKDIVKIEDLWKRL